MERLAEKAKTKNISDIYFIKTKQPIPHNENRTLSLYIFRLWPEIGVKATHKERLYQGAVWCNLQPQSSSVPTTTAWAKPRSSSIPTMSAALHRAAHTNFCQSLEFGQAAGRDFHFTCKHWELEEGGEKRKHQKKNQKKPPLVLPQEI